MYKPDYLGNNFQRISSYRQQLILTGSNAEESVLLVGKGDGYVSDILAQMGVTVKTLDIQENLSPDLLGSVNKIPCESNSFDKAVCCQVLEHLPFDQLSDNINELCRVSRTKVILSIPDVRRFLGFKLKFQNRELNVQFSFGKIFPKRIDKLQFETLGHYWEIGYKDSTYKMVKKNLSPKGWKITQETRVHDLPWHTFFVFEPE